MTQPQTDNAYLRMLALGSVGGFAATAGAATSPTFAAEFSESLLSNTFTIQGETIMAIVELGGTDAVNLALQTSLDQGATWINTGVTATSSNASAVYIAPSVFTGKIAAVPGALFRWAATPTLSTDATLTIRMGAA